MPSSFRCTSLILFAWLALTSCSEQALLIVTVETDLVVDVDFDHVDIEVTGASIRTNDPAEPNVRTLSRAAEDLPALPFSFVLDHEDADLEVVAQLTRTQTGAGVVVAQRVSVAYPKHGTRVLRITLERTCAGIVSCDSSETCAGGECVAVRRAGALPRVDEGHELDGLRSPPEAVVRNGFARRHVRYNSQLEVDHVSFADVDKSGDHDMVQWASTGMFATQIDGHGTGIAHLYDELELASVISGEFDHTGRDFQCLRRVVGSVYCFGLNRAGGGFNNWFWQTGLFEPDQEIVVGDFDGNAVDDILVLRSSGGSRVLRVVHTEVPLQTYFAEMSFIAAELPTYFDRPVRVRAADFSGDGRTDLLLVDRSGRMSRHDANIESDSLVFKQRWSMPEGTVAPGEEVLVAAIDNDAFDDIHLHDLSTGTHRFFHAELDPNHALVPITDVRPPASTGRDVPVRWAHVRQEPGVNAMRDDLVVFAPGGLRTFEATFSTAHGYVEGVTQPRPLNHEWPKPAITSWQAVQCRYQDLAGTPATGAYAADIGWRMAEMGLWHIAEASYGLVRLRSAPTGTWKTSTLSTAHAGDSASALVNDCLGASGVAASTFGPITAFWNGPNAPPRTDGRFAFVPFASIPSGDSGTPTRFLQTIAEQLGVGPAYRGPVESPVLEANGHGFPGVERLLLVGEGRIPASRIVELTSKGPDDDRPHMILGAINRPETSAPLLVRSRLPDGTYYTVELRSPTEYGFVEDVRISVHRYYVVNGRPSSVRLLPVGDVPLTNGQQYDVDGLTLVVHSIHTSGTWADITVSVW